MDPRQMFHEIRRDIEARPGIGVALVLLVAVGIAGWIPASGANRSRLTTAARSSPVLSDPFASQTK
jgi:hypothetical protein